MTKKVFTLLFMLLFLSSAAFGQTQKAHWVDSVFAELNMAEKIGQLFMLPVEKYEAAEIEKIEAQLMSFKIGGIVFKSGSPVKQANLTNHFQSFTQTPLLIGMNAESGLGAVLDSTIQFAPPLLLGAIQDDSLLYFLGSEVGRQLNELGVHINFGPTTDFSQAFKNGEKKYSGYGENKNRVASKIIAYQNGLKSRNVVSIGKQYISGNNIAADGLFPLKAFCENGGAGLVMEEIGAMASFNVMHITGKNFEPNVLSPLFSGNQLKASLKFNGLVFSPVPDILPLNKNLKAGDAEVFAFRTGSDVLLFSKNIGAAIRKLRKVIRKDVAFKMQLDETVKKILNIKYDVGLNRKSAVRTENLANRLNSPTASILETTLLEKSVTVVKDELNLLPIKQLENQSFASLSIGATKNNLCAKYLDKYSQFTHFQLQSVSDTTDLLKNLQPYSIVVASIYPNISVVENLYAPILEKISKRATVIVVVFANPSLLNLIEHFPILIEAYLDHGQMEKFIPQLIFGAAKATATLPVSINKSLQEGEGVETSLLGRLGYATPETVGINGKMLESINTIVQEAIDKKTTPGCQVIVARRGKIIYEQSTGWQTYDNTIPIDNQSIYDLASVTKVAATLQTTMFLYEKGILDIYKKASHYLPELLTSNKRDIIVKDILTHQAGLTPFVPFWIQTVKDADFLPQYYSNKKSEMYPLQIAPNLFGIKSLRDSLWSWSIQSKLREKPPRTPYNYVYSDVGLYILFHLNEKLLNQSQDEFLEQNLYEPIGASTMGYLPLERFSPSRIVPTEIDTLFRKSLLLGTAHDEGAAMLGGVAGHAGLFSNAIDLAKIGQMLLQNGFYGGQHYFKTPTVQYFATKQFETSRRGLGWDKPVQSEWNSPTSILASPNTFGHTGFTGTCIWIDPEFELVYVFLSNRVYPNRSNTKLSTLNIRSRIQDMIYQSIFSYGQYGSSHNDIERYLKSALKNNP